MRGLCVARLCYPLPCRGCLGIDHALGDIHGRNAAKWWQHEHAYERYDYLYTEEELAEWVPRIRELAERTEKTYLFFNNHYQGKAGQNAQMMADLLNLKLPLAATG